MGNLCICSMQVHQSRFSLSFLPHPPLHKSSTVVSFLVLVGLCASVHVGQHPPRSHSLPRCCSLPPFSEPGRGTCTYLHPGTGTYTQWLRRAGCCRDITEVNLAHDRWSDHFKKLEGSPFHEVDHVDDARRTDHWLVGEDGPHGLFHTELGLQGRQKRLNFLSECGKKKNKTIFLKKWLQFVIIGIEKRKNRNGGTGDHCVKFNVR